MGRRGSRRGRIHPDLDLLEENGLFLRMGIDPSEKTALIVTGPFARVRHPIYALSSVLMLATVAAQPCLLMIAVAVIHLGLLQLEVRRQEKYLLNLHGHSYSEYCTRVGRFFPKL